MTENAIQTQPKFMHIKGWGQRENFMVSSSLSWWLFSSVFIHCLKNVNEKNKIKSVGLSLFIIINICLNQNIQISWVCRIEFMRRNNKTGVDARIKGFLSKVLLS